MKKLQHSLIKNGGNGEKEHAPSLHNFLIDTSNR